MKYIEIFILKYKKKFCQHGRHGTNPKYGGSIDIKLDIYNKNSALEEKTFPNWNLFHHHWQTGRSGAQSFRVSKKYSQTTCIKKPHL